MTSAAVLAKNLARLRKEKGMTREELAEASGLGIATVARIEQGDGTKLEFCDKLAQALGVKFDQLFKVSR